MNFEEIKEHDEKCYYEVNKRDLFTDFKEYNKAFKNIKNNINKQIEKLVNRLGELKRNKVVILSGFPGSGKSTITEGLKNLDYKVLSLDDKIKDYKELIKKTQYYIKRKTSNNIVLDGTFLKQEQIDMFKWVNDVVNYDLITIHIDIPVEYAYFNNIKRCLDKRNKRTALPFRVYKQMDGTKTVKIAENDTYVIKYE